MQEPSNKMYIDFDYDRSPRGGKGQKPQGGGQKPQGGGGQKPPGRGNRNKKSIRVLVVALCFLLAALLGCGIFVYVNVSKIWGGLGDSGNNMQVAEYDTDEGAAELPEVSFTQGAVSNIQKSAGETDILLIGVDNRDTDKFSGRSDVMMFLRVNPEKKTIKLASFMRDTLVNIDGHGKNKLNTAYNFGSIELAKKTYNESFGLTPDYYMVVNFFGMEDIIDALGGVDIELEKDELPSLNESIREANSVSSGKDIGGIRSAGEQHLNGRQAVAYMRIRHPGGDDGRIARQQKVLAKLFGEMKNINVGEIPSLITTLSQYVRTDIPLGGMLDLAKAVKGMDSSALKTFRYPEDFKNGGYQSMSVVLPKDFDAEFAKLNDFLEK